ncbi:uncharacterized protein LOC131225243 [Magnolia sinica]|uniref:uncharacterized protein LOC131225243 n=1 Tax=Magnolia sinica TaxID=86752 RepID=UPI002657E4EA|nr:uncharacterized protein LOC131225243 [Magnolia sinica]
MAEYDLIDRRSDRWKSKFRALQLRIRDRFRVAVDRHRRWQRFSDSNDSSLLQRWILRLRSLRRASSLPPTPFYRKRVSTDVDAIEDSIIVRMLQGLAVPILGNACHVFMHGLNRVQIYGAEKLHQALLQRSEGKPLITVSNHVAAVDDPFVIASLLPPSVLLDANSLRWTLCATDRCFSNPVTSAFFRCVKVLPVSRGDGVYQKGMDMALSKLNQGGWVHIFPEGSRSRDGGRTMGSAKRGVGRLVMDADNIPIVLPFVHTGMEDIMPIGTHFPKIGKMVTVLIGDPIHFDDLLLTNDDAQHISRETLYDVVSSRIGQRLHELKIQVERLALEQLSEVRDYSLQNTKRANGILQQVDWEAFGMGSYVFTDVNSPSLKQAIQTLTKPHLDQSQGAAPPNWHVRMGFSYEGGIVSRIRGYMNPSELMGFAVKGLFMNGRTSKENPISIREVRPLKAWKQYLEGNIFQQWNCM